jgi:hypothetical protein
MVNSKLPSKDLNFLGEFSLRDNLWWWCGVNIDDRPVGNPKGRYDEHSSKSSLSCETKVYRTSRRKNKTSEGDAC